MLNNLTYHYQNKHYYFPLIIAFLLPLGFPVPLIIAVWIIAFFSLNANLKTIVKKVFQNKWLYVYWSFFAIHAIGYFFSYNKTEALTAIETKLTFFILPFLVFGIEYKQEQFAKIKLAFVLGCLSLLLICFARALYLLLTHQVYSFFYSEFTYLFHPSYFAMYLMFAILILLLDKEKDYVLIKSGLMNALIIFFFVVGVFLASSKMGIISAAILLPSILSIKLYKLGYKKSIAIILITFIGIIITLYQLFPDKFERFNNAISVTTSNQQIDLTSTESTAVRILIWKEAIDIIKQNPLLGTAVGDANDALYKAYEQKGLTGALSKKLNAHNQFLQTFIGIGIIGFIVLLILTVGSLAYAFIKKHYLFVVFSTLIILNFLVESMLQAQAGFIFFVFFSTLLINSTLKKNSLIH